MAILDEASGYTFVPRNDVERVVYDYAKGKLFWSKARYALAEIYASGNQWSRARRECEALARQAPYSYDPPLRIADYYRQEGDTARARLMYERSLSVEDNGFAHARLALMSLDRDDAATAASQIQAALASEARTPRFTAEQTATAHYVFAVALARLGDIPRARTEAETAIAIDPSQEGAKELLREIQRGQERK